MGGVKKYSYKYLFPYLITGIILLLLIPIILLFSQSIQYSHTGFSTHLYERIENLCIALIFGSGWAGSWADAQKTELFGDMPMIGAIWFLFALFWACLLYSTLKRTYKGVALLGMVLGSFFIAIYSIRVIRLPFSIQAGMAAVLFLHIGNLIRNYDIIKEMSHFKLSEHTPFLMIWLLCIYFWLMRSSTCYYPGFSVLGGIIGSCYLLMICARLNLKVGWIGTHTLELLCGNAIVLYIKMFYIHLPDITMFAWINLMIELSIDAFLSIGIGYFIYRSKILRIV